LTSAQRRKRDENDVDKHFDVDRLNREITATSHDSQRRLTRQSAIKKKRIEAEMLKNNVKGPELPNYKLDTVLDYRASVRNVLIDSMVFGAELPKGKAMLRIAENVTEALNLSQEHVGLVLDAFSPYSQGMRQSDIDKFSYRLAGNYKTLRKGIPIRVWTSQDEIDEWGLLKVVRVQEGFEDTDGNDGFYLGMEIYSGILAGNQLVVGYSRGVESSFARKFGVANRDVKKTIPQFLISMIGYGYVTRGWQGHPRVRLIEATSSHKKANRALLQRRIDPALCPHELRPDIVNNCLECPVGRGISMFGQPECSAAIREKTDEAWQDQEAQEHLLKLRQEEEEAWIRKLQNS